MKLKLPLLFICTTLLSGCFWNSKQEVHIKIPAFGDWNQDVKTQNLKPTQEVLLSWSYSDDDNPAQFLLIKTSWGRSVQKLKTSQRKILIKKSMFHDSELAPHPTPTFIDVWFYSNETLAEDYSVPTKEVYYRTRFSLQK